VFNQYDHFEDEFNPLNDHFMKPEDQEIYRARVLKYRPHLKWESLDRLFTNCLFHADRNVPGKVSYFATIEALRADRVTRTSPEMFAERWLANAPYELRMLFAAEVQGKLLPEIKFIDNTDSDGGIRIYEDGPHSCMAGTTIVGNYAHPENDLALAYHATETGRIKNRCIVNKKKMKYVRIYGKDGDAFAASLRKLGYNCDCDEALRDQKIRVQKEQCTRCEDMLIAGPYLDSGHDHVKVISDDDDNDNLTGIITNEGTTPLINDNDGDGYVCNGCG
jgi:hypothetical protein